jgi:type III restriction enzyme
MAIQHVNAISNRLSLRPPQRDSLEILARLCDIVSLSKGADAAVALEAVKSEFPSVEDFERDFPSLCFAIATGVGKTRLMGAFISYLYLSEGYPQLLRARAESDDLQQAHRGLHAEHIEVRVSRNR